MTPGAGTRDGRLLMDGQRIDGGGTYPLVDPYRGEHLAEVAVAEAVQVAEAVRVSYDRGRAELAALPLHARTRILRDAAARIAALKPQLAEAISRQTGKAIRDSLREVDRSTYTIASVCAAAEQLTGDLLASDATPGGEGLMTMIRREPLGVVAAIAPFNAPFNLSMHKVAAALVTGNAVVLKPAPQAPLSGFGLGEILLEAGIPASALHVLTGGADVGAALVAHPDVAGITFTGGVVGGAAIVRTAGAKPVILELGGNSPNIVHADADLDWTASALVAGAYSNTGQSCNSVQRVIVQRDVAGALADRLVERTERLITGDPLDARTDVGTLVDETSARRVEAWVNEAVAGGAAVLTGGRRDGAAYLPTVIAHAAPAMRVACEEIFGPVLVLLDYDELDEAIDIANDTPFGLQSAIFTSALDTAFRFVSGVEAGGVMVNRSSNFRLDHAPFGGVKASGFGREGGRYTLEALTRTKLVIIDPSLTGAPHPLAR